MNKLNTFIRFFIIIFLLFVYFASRYADFYLYFLILNVFLAYIPFEISNLTCKFNNKVIIILLSLLWLLFYPNAPYLLTDFFHLEALNIYELTTTFNFILKDWIVFSIITCGLLFGFVIGIISLLRIVKKLQLTFFYNESNFKTFILILLITLASGFAIYLGRFPRLHSHYLFSNPIFILETIIQSINLNSFIFTIAMSLWQLFIIYLIKFFKEDNII
ncbi:putative membrane protein [Bacilli bacterium PM5-3]|nr:putative membrane protein [Bacilli bacterium PM5-3]MDH6603105.1 putative membrane protein [Bacilli bacterium PM5-9]